MNVLNHNPLSLLTLTLRNYSDLDTFYEQQGSRIDSCCWSAIWSASSHSCKRSIMKTTFYENHHSLTFLSKSEQLAWIQIHMVWCIKQVCVCLLEQEKSGIRHENWDECIMTVMVIILMIVTIAIITLHTNNTAVNDEDSKSWKSHDLNV